MTEDQFKKVLDKQLTHFYGQLAQHIDQRIKEVNGRLDVHEERIDQIRNTVDGIAADLTTDREERAAIIAQQDRQTGWIKQLADSTDTKLVPEP